CCDCSMRSSTTSAMARRAPLGGRPVRRGWSLLHQDWRSFGWRRLAACNWTRGQPSGLANPFPEIQGRLKRPLQRIIQLWLKPAAQVFPAIDNIAEELGGFFGVVQRGVSLPAAELNTG